MIVLELPLAEKKLIETEIQNSSLQVDFLEKKNFNGQSAALEILITLSATSLPFIAKIIIEQIRAKKHIVVKHKGITIKGLSEQNALEILEKLMEKKK